MKDGITSGTLIGFDYGTQRTGVAVGNPLTGNARPLTTLKMQNSHPDWTAIEKLIQEWAPAQLIVGRPTRMDGTTIPMTKAAESFAKALQNRFSLPVSLVDERLSSREAETELHRQRKAGVRGRIRKDEVDQEAAAVILRDWLAQNTHYSDRSIPL